MTVRRFILLLLLGYACAHAQQTATVEPTLPEYLSNVPAPLATAVHKLTGDINRWAYTQRSLNYNGKGEVDEEIVARFDPSQHYDEQWTLISRNGKPANEEQIRKYRRQRAKRLKNRQSLGELLELSKAVIAEESAQRVIYEVPLREENNDRLPPDKFQILISVLKPSHGLEQIDLSLRAPMRVALIAKVKNAGAALRFDTVDPAYAPTLVEIDATGNFTVMMVRMSDTYKLSRTDFKRVKPYDERFGVTIGPMKVIDF